MAKEHYITLVPGGALTLLLLVLVSSTILIVGVCSQGEEEYSSDKVEDVSEQLDEDLDYVRQLTGARREPPKKRTVKKFRQLEGSKNKRSNDSTYDYYDGDAGGDVNGAPSNSSVANGLPPMRPNKKKKAPKPDAGAGAGGTKMVPGTGPNVNDVKKNVTNIPPLTKGPMSTPMKNSSDDVFKNYCTDYGLPECDVDSARVGKDGCSVECKNFNSAINVYLPNGHPCTPAKSNYSCSYGKCTRMGSPVSNQTVKLSLKIIHLSNIMNNDERPMYIVAHLSGVAQGQDVMDKSQSLICMTYTTKLKKLWWFHKCQSRLVSKSSAIEFELRTSNENQPLFKGLVSLKDVEASEPYNIVKVPLMSAVNKGQSRFGLDILCSWVDGLLGHKKESGKKQEEERKKKEEQHRKRIEEEQRKRKEMEDRKKKEICKKLCGPCRSPPVPEPPKCPVCPLCASSKPQICPTLKPLVCPVCPTPPYTTTIPTTPPRQTSYIPKQASDESPTLTIVIGFNR